MEEREGEGEGDKRRGRVEGGDGVSGYRSWLPGRYHRALAFYPIYTPLCVRVPINTWCSTRARVNSGMLRSYVGRIYTHTSKGSQGSRVYVCDCGLGTYSITGDLLGQVIPFSRL